MWRWWRSGYCKGLADKTIIEPDIYNELFKIESTGEVFCANLCWREKKMFLFLSDNDNDYEVAKKTGWNCICTADVDSLEKYEVGE